MCPRFTPDCVTLPNSVNGRFRSKRLTVAEENKLVTRNPATPRSGLATWASQKDRLPPLVMSHCRAKSQLGRFRFLFPEYARVRLPTYEISTTELAPIWYWKPAENWCTRGIL